MKKSNHPVSKLRKYVKKHGIQILLPQKLPDDIFKRLTVEVKAFHEGRTDETPSSALLMCILYLKNGSKVSDNMKIKFSEEELFDYFTMYAVCIKLEDMRRSGLVYIPEHSLPTLKNIFDKSRSMEIEGLDE